ncbi:MAG: hypothetical protein H6Q89_2706 [Myxococcaceae bacterium]|nr:hypothetical protein [Myxococcaceae bacterium]
MSILFAGGVAVAYASTVIGLHRLNVRRMRAQAGGFPTLRRLDWQSLLAGLLPAPDGPVADGPPELPPLLRAPPPKDAEARHAMLTAIVSGASVEPARFESAGFSGGESQWLTTLALAQARPHDALDRLFSSRPGTSAEVYLREHLFLQHRVNPLNLELSVFATKRRLAAALGRFADAPTLYFARAQASAQLGFNQAVLDDLARAVYFSRHAPFYLKVITELPWVGEARPALYQQCIALLTAAPSA